MTLHPIWHGLAHSYHKYIYLIYLTKSFGKPLLGDELALFLNVIGDKELGLALAPDIGGVMQVHIQSSSDTEFV